MRFCLILAILLVSCSALFSQFHIAGNTQSLAYSFADRNEDGQFDFYQGLQLKLTHDKLKSTSISAYLREAYYGEVDEWNGKLYKLYLTNMMFNNRLNTRIGRQFIYKGVVNGTIDGLTINAKINKNVDLGFMAGSLAPIDRDFKVGNWDNGNLLGAYAGYRYLKHHTLQFSYVRKQMYTELGWHQAGINLIGYIGKKLNYYSRVDYNLESSDLQRLRLRGDYRLTDFTLGMEYTLQKPMIYEFSYFNVFDIKAYNQIRSTLGYHWKSYMFQINHIFTMFEDDESHGLSFDISKRRNSLGVIYNNGFTGNSFGVYGKILYPVWKKLSLRLYGSYHNYERYMIDISENATSFSAGLQYQLKNAYIRADIQEVSNNVMKKDLRGYLQYIYSFNL